MRSPADVRRRLRLCCAALLLAPWTLPAADAVAPAPSASASATDTPERVRGIVAELRADPEFSGMHTERRLRWKQEDAPTRERPSSAPWLIELVRWLAEAGRGVMWLLGAIAVAVFAVCAWRWARVQADAARTRAAPRPSHVHDLDIRPESLPVDMAGAARALWQRGEHRAALSLLYRGALSRLVHGHAVPIRAASTEGECVRLAARLLPPEGGRFFERLVQAWLVSVYGARTPAEAEVLALCDEFDRRLPAQAGAAA